MSTVQLNLTDNQIFELIEQLDQDKQDAILDFLLTKQWPQWVALSKYGEGKARKVAAQRNRNWDVMSEEEKEYFVDEILHED